MMCKKYPIRISFCERGALKKERKTVDGCFYKQGNMRMFQINRNIDKKWSVYLVKFQISSLDIEITQRIIFKLIFLLLNIKSYKKLLLSEIVFHSLKSLMVTGQVVPKSASILA